MSEVLRGPDAIEYAIENRCRLVLDDGLLLDPFDEHETKEIARLIFQGYEERLTVEDPTRWKELSELS